MSSKLSKKKIPQDELPEDFTTDITDTVFRIDDNINVIGVMYIKNGLIKMSTVQETLAVTMCARLPTVTKNIRNALAEINVLDELVAYRVITKTKELLVVPIDNRLACALLKTKKRKKTYL